MFTRLIRHATLICHHKVVAACMLVASSLAYGQALDSVDVVNNGNETEVIIRFVPRVQYLRHAPVDFGKSVRVYLQLVGLGIQPGDLVRATKHLPKTDRSPHMTISYPELDKSLLINFEEPVRYSVRPGADGRSISILLPTQPKE